MRIILIFNILLLSSCQYFRPKDETLDPIIARVGNHTLVTSDLSGFIPALSSVDSAIFVDKFILDWVKKQLMIAKAEEAIDFNVARIQKRVLDYQYALMVHELEQKYIDKNLNQEVSEKEIIEYYEQKSENFVLRQNLVRCLYFKVPSNASNIWRLRRGLKNYPKDTAQIWEYVKTHAIKTFIEDSIWVKFDEILLETPLKESNNKASFLKKNKSIEVSDKDYIYFIKIFEYRLVGETSPLEVIKESILDIIINKRKIVLKKELEKKIYEQAEQTNAFEIYTN